MRLALSSPPNCFSMSWSRERRAWKYSSDVIFSPLRLTSVFGPPDLPIAPPPAPQMAKMATMKVATMSHRMGLSDLTFFLMVLSMALPRTAPRVPVEQRPQLPIGGVQVLDEDLGLPDEGHEVRVPGPAGDD